MRIEDKVALPEAVDRLIHALKADEGYYISWQANIAVQFQDEMARNQDLSDVERERIHTVSNEAAKNFLNMLCKTGDPAIDESEFEPVLPGVVTPGVVLADNGGSMDDIVGKSAEEVFPEVIKGVKGTVEAFPEFDEKTEDHDLSELIKEREDQDEIKIDPEDL